MNKKLLLTFYFCILSTFIFSQPYVRLGGGYHFPQPNMVFAHSQTVTSSIASKGSLGKGYNPSINIGYQLNEHLGFELSASYLVGRKMTAYIGTAPNASYISFSAKRFCINPSVVFNSKILSEKLHLRGQLGVIVSPKTILFREMIGTNFEQLVKIKTKFNLGYFGALGLHYQSKSRISYYADVIVNSSTIYTKSAEMIKYNSYGIDKLPQMEDKDKKWNYFTEVKGNSNNNDQLVQSYLMNSLGLNFGIQYSLHK